MSLINSVGRFINAANLKADALTAGIKGVLCLPSIVAGLPDLGKGLIGSVTAQLTKTLESTVGAISGIVTNTINGAVSEITGAISGVLDQVNSFLYELKAAFDKVYAIQRDVRERSKNIKEFISDKENCNFAAAQMLNCIVAQAVGEVSKKGAIDIAKGLKPVSDAASDIADKIAAPGGAISRGVKKQADEIDRATRVVQTQDIL